MHTSCVSEHKAEPLSVLRSESRRPSSLKTAEILWFSGSPCWRVRLLQLLDNVLHLKWNMFVGDECTSSHVACFVVRVDGDDSIFCLPQKHPKSRCSPERCILFIVITHQDTKTTSYNLLAQGLTLQEQNQFQFLSDSKIIIIKKKIIHWKQEKIKYPCKGFGILGWEHVVAVLLAFIYFSHFF